jgi:hypothetical protein
LGTNNKLKITHNKIKINMQNKNMHDDEMWLCKRGYGLKMRKMI